MRVDGVAIKPKGVQSRPITWKGSLIVVPLTLAVAVSSTLNVPAWARLEPNNATLVPSTFIKDGTVFKLYATESPQAGL